MNSANGGDILYHFKGDTSDLDKKTKDMGKNLKDSLNTIGNAMTLGVTVPLTAIATAGVKYNAELESYTANLTTLLGGNKKQAEELLNTLKETAKTTPYETSQLVKATQTMMSFGISADNAKKYLNQIGDISMGNAEKLSGLTLAFSQVQSAGKLTGQDLLQMINQGFNPLNIISKETGESMASLKERMGEGGVSAEEVAHAFEIATSKGGLFYQGMEKGAKTTEGQISTLKDSFKEATGSLTEALLPTLLSLVQTLTKVADWFNNLSDEGKKTILIIGGIVASIGPLIKVGLGIAKIVGAFKTLVTIIKGLQLATKAMTIAQVAFNAVLAINPIFLIIMAVIALIAVLVLLWKKCEGFRNAVMSIFEVIGSAIKSVISFFKPIINFIVMLVVNYIQFYANIIKTVIKGLVIFIKNPIETIGYIIGYVIGTIIKLVSGAIAFIQSIPEKVGAIVETIKTKIVQFLTVIWEFITVTIPAIINSAIIWIQELPDRVWDILRKIILSVVLWGTEMFNKAKQAVKNVVNGIIQWFKELPNNMKNIGKNIVEGLWKGIQNAKQWIKDKVKDFAKGILKGMKDALGIHSPSTEFAILGKFSVLGYTEQLDKMKKQVQEQVQDTFGISPTLIGTMNTHYSPNIIVNNNVSMETDPLGQTVSRIKTFSGGAKNDYNYGMGG